MVTTNTGGGVIGLSTAYHLCERGFKNVVILERHKITSGTTWHTAGIQQSFNIFLSYKFALVFINDL